MPRRDEDDARDGEEALNVREEMSKRRSKVGRIIDVTSRKLANPWTFFVLLVLHLVWVVLNIPAVPLIDPWDPPPFTGLATIASALAPFVSLMILMGQYRDSRITELREEIALQVAFRSDRELTLLLQAFDERARRIERDTYDVDQLQKPLDPDELLHRVRKHLEGSQGKTTGEEPENAEEGSSSSRAQAPQARVETDR